MVRHTKLSLVVLISVLILAACSGGPPKRVYPPTASIQQLTVEADGQWLLQIRIQSFSNVPHTVSELSAQMRVDGIEAATLQLSPTVAIGPQSVEVEELRLVPTSDAAARVNAALESGRRVDYVLTGNLNSSAPDKRKDTFTFDGQLWPMPGLPGVLR